MYIYKNGYRNSIYPNVLLPEISTIVEKKRFGARITNPLFSQLIDGGGAVVSHDQRFHCGASITERGQLLRRDLRMGRILSSPVATIRQDHVSWITPRRLLRADNRCPATHVIVAVVLVHVLSILRTRLPVPLRVQLNPRLPLVASIDQLAILRLDRIIVISFLPTIFGLFVKYVRISYIIGRNIVVIWRSCE